MFIEFRIIIYNFIFVKFKNYFIYHFYNKEKKMIWQRLKTMKVVIIPTSLC
ncbi:hypothetical protein C414_000390041 [Campylobacter jejuni subsp. jejuni 414]|nr:hypothetical protein C414_000390041 [Campylobacter jejuni subsp. jejuni 414]